MSDESKWTKYSPFWTANTVSVSRRFFVCLNLDSHYCIQNSQSLVQVLITMNSINTLPFGFKIHSHMILPSTPRSSNFPFIQSFRDNTLISHYNVLSHLFILHTRSGVLSALQNKSTVLLKVTNNVFSLYVRMLGVASAGAAAISIPLTPASAVVCINVFLISLIISHCPSTRKLCKLLRVLKNNFNDTSVFSDLSGRW
jgi:hypothetical protein